MLDLMGMGRGVTLSSIPPAADRAVRMASIAPHVVAMFTHLPHPIVIDVELPDDVGAVPESALSLLKLPLAAPAVTLGSVRGRPSGTRVTVSVSTAKDRWCVLEDRELRQDLRVVARTILSSLFDGADVARVLELFAFQSSNLTTLQRITNQMLQATDVDRALWVMLSGMTSGHGLSFNRAALFVHDEARKEFVGAKAIGPADEAEAHRIWEAIELEEKSLEHLLDDSSHQRFDTRFHDEVQRLTIKPSELAGDEVAAALDGRPWVCASGPAVNPSLGALDGGFGFVLAAIGSHGHVRGLLFADNRYSRQPVTPEQRSYIGFYIDQTALVWENLSLIERVEALARSDALTGVYNRREFEARFEAERSRCARSGGRCGIMTIDVDHFKSINDTRGHAAGDDVLRKLGAILHRYVREHDVAARLGGDEFVLLLPDVTNEQLATTAQRIGALAAGEGVSLSIGGASWPGDTAKLDDLLEVADAQLYEAKRAGRGCAFVRGVRMSFSGREGTAGSAFAEAEV